MEQRSRTVVSEEGAKPEDLAQGSLALIRPWRPSRMKTGLRNRSIGRRVYVVAPRRAS